MFFENFNVNKTSKIGITNLLGNITTREGSHKGGWSRLLKCQLFNLGYSDVTILSSDDNFGDFDNIIFDLGAEYSGALNLFGGLDEKVYKRLWDILKFKGSFYTWRNDLPDVSVLKSRANNESTCEAFKSERSDFIDDVAIKLSSCKRFDHAYLTDKLLIGDSHTPSVWTPEFMIERRDGRTLEGMIKHETLKRYVNQFQFNGMRINAIQVHCGSIDIRHHVHRQEKPDEYIAKLATRLLDQMLWYPEAKLITTHTMGIEDESRKLPKTGYYKGTPFFGSWEDRNVSRQIFNAMMDGIAVLEVESSTVKLPDYFFDRDGKLGFHVMEKPQSVHISPEHYRWNLEKNELRWSPMNAMIADIERTMFYGPR